MHNKSLEKELIDRQFNKDISLYFEVAEPEQLSSFLSVQHFCEATKTEGGLLKKIISQDKSILQPTVPEETLNIIALKLRLRDKLQSQGVSFDDYFDDRFGSISLANEAHHFGFCDIQDIHESDFQDYSSELTQKVCNIEDMPLRYPIYDVSPKHLESFKQYMLQIDDFRLTYDSVLKFHDNFIKQNL